MVSVSNFWSFSVSPRAKRWLWRFGRLYLLLVLLMMFFESSLLFHPAPYEANSPDWRLPSHCEDAHFEAADGVKLHGWFLPHPQSQAVVLFHNGNAGNITYRTDFLHLFHQRLRASIMLFDYRGFGRSEGKPDEAGLLADARAARAWLAQRAGVAERDIVLVGQSLGGGVAVDLAASDGARGLVLQNTYTTLCDVGAYHFPFLPVRWLMRTRLESVNKIARYHGPLFQSHGTADEVVPYSLGETLFAAANEPKTFLPLSGGRHNDLLPGSYWSALAAWLATLPPVANASGEP